MILYFPEKVFVVQIRYQWAVNYPVQSPTSVKWRFPIILCWVLWLGTCGFFWLLSRALVLDISWWDLRSDIFIWITLENPQRKRPTGIWSKIKTLWLKKLLFELGSRIQSRNLFQWHCDPGLTSSGSISTSWMRERKKKKRVNSCHVQSYIATRLPSACIKSPPPT